MNPQTSAVPAVPPLIPITSPASQSQLPQKSVVPCKTLQETIKAIENQISMIESLEQPTSKHEGDLIKLRELHQKALQEQDRLRAEKMQVNVTQVHQQPNSATQTIKSLPSSSNNNSNIQFGTSSSSSTGSHSQQHSSASTRDATTMQDSPISMSVAASGDAGADTLKILNKKKIQDLVREVDPNTRLDEDVEEMLLQIADDFIENIVTAGCQLAKHRKSSTLEEKDILLHLERNWNMWIPGYTPEEQQKSHKRPAATEAHKQRMALIRKTLKK